MPLLNPIHKYVALKNFIRRRFGRVSVENGVRYLSKNIYSLFGEFKFLRGKMSLIGRYDYFNLAKSDCKRYILGVAYHINRKCKLLIDYDDVKAYGADDVRFEFAVEVHY